VRVVLNPAPARPLPAQLLKRIFLLTPNESEAERLTGLAVTNEATAARAAEKLLARGVQNVIVTMGSRGAFVAGKDLRQMIPGFKVNAVEAEGRPLLEAARFASAAAAISVTRFGAQPSAPTRREIQALLAMGGIETRVKARRQK